MISAFLEKLFTKYVDYDFTAKLEDQLDDITSGKEDWIEVLNIFFNFFFIFYLMYNHINELRNSF